MTYSSRSPRPSVIVALLSLASFACAVGTTGTGDGTPSSADASPDAPASTGPEDVDSGSPPVDDAGAASPDTGAKSDGGSAKDSGAKADAGSSAVCAQPSKPAGCNGGCTAHVCSANGCYNGYLCDTTTLKCKAPGLCP